MRDRRDETVYRTRDNWSDAERERRADQAADREQVARAIAERDRRIRQRAKRAVDEWVKQVLTDQRAVDFHGALAGAPEGILMGWIMDLNALMNQLEDLLDALTHHEIEQSVGIKQARTAVLTALYSMRPDLHLLPWVDLNARTGVLAEVGQYAAATRRLAQELMSLLRECQPTASTPVQPMLLP